MIFFKICFPEAKCIPSSVLWLMTLPTLLIEKTLPEDLELRQNVAVLGMSSLLLSAVGEFALAIIRERQTSPRARLRAKLGQGIFEIHRTSNSFSRKVSDYSGAIPSSSSSGELLVVMRLKGMSEI